MVVHYSGHGSQMTDIEGDEPDGLDETSSSRGDSGRAPHENRDIKDDEIYLWLKDLTAKTSNVTLIFDCCHSGTIVRDDFGGEARWVEPDLRPAEQLPPSPIPDGLPRVARRWPGRRSQRLAALGERYSCSPGAAGRRSPSRWRRRGREPPRAR